MAGKIRAMTRMPLAVGWLLTTFLVASGDEDDWLRPLGPPPAAAPRRISGGEGVPPLPLPATPLRRTERKREPAPPALVTKVMWGESAMFTYESGNQVAVADWNQCPADLQQLLRKFHSGMNLPYSHHALPLTEFDGDPVKMPLLLFNGSRSMKLEEKQIELLRRYVLRGGMLFFDSIAGSPYFYESAKQLLAQAFPDLRLRVVPPDHPFYHMLFSVATVRYPKNLDATAPVMEGLYVGSRLGAVVSRYGLGCAWDNREVPLLEQAIYYDLESANQIGMNLMAYVVGYAAAGREEAKPELFGAADEKRPTDEFVFAQIKHDGAWNVHPGAAAALLRRLRQNTSLRVSLKRVAVDPATDDLSPYPFLYLTGLDDFRLDDRALAALRGFLDRSGTLVINNGLGLKSFDAVVRRELQRLLPGAALTPVPADHPLYSSVFRIVESRYTPAVMKERPDMKAPLLEGLSAGGDLRVIYSPFDLEAAWLGCDYPLARAYEPASGMELGINLVMYVMTH